MHQSLGVVTVGVVTCMSNCNYLYNCNSIIAIGIDLASHNEPFYL